MTSFLRWLAVGLIVLCPFSPSVMAASSLLDTIDRLDREDQQSFDSVLQHLQTCLAQSDLSCAERDLKSAKDMASGSDQSRRVKQAEASIEARRNAIKEQRFNDELRASQRAQAEERRRVQQQAAQQAEAQRQADAQWNARTQADLAKLNATPSFVIVQNQLAAERQRLQAQTQHGSTVSTGNRGGSAPSGSRERSSGNSDGDMADDAGIQSQVPSDKGPKIPYVNFVSIAPNHAHIPCGEIIAPLQKNASKNVLYNCPLGSWSEKSEDISASAQYRLCSSAKTRAINEATQQNKAAVANGLLQDFYSLGAACECKGSGGSSDASGKYLAQGSQRYVMCRAAAAMRETHKP